MAIICFNLGDSNTQPRKERQMMTKSKCDGYVDEIQECMDGDVFKTMLEIMAQRVMEEELALHLGAERHKRAPVEDAGWRVEV